MTTKLEKKPIDEWFGEQIQPGEAKDVFLKVGESYSSVELNIPIHIRRAKEAGPVVFVTAALHGDEINGTGAIRQLINDDGLELKRGSLILVPVLNLPGFDRHSRYLPDRRDLNRSFPGTRGGSLASRMAYVIFNEIVSRSDYGIDLHTAAVRRTNYPNVRGDLSVPEIKALAMAFGSEIIMDNRGPVGAFRREACRVGCPTIIMEGGEVWKVEPSIVESATNGVLNVLRHLEMIDSEPYKPPFSITIRKTSWIRAQRGGFLQFHIQPGELVEKDQPLATNTTILGRRQNVVVAPFKGVVIGMTSLPSVSPGEPICHLGKLPTRTSIKSLLEKRQKAASLIQRISDDLASSVMVEEPEQST